MSNKSFHKLQNLQKKCKQDNSCFNRPYFTLTHVWFFPLCMLNCHRKCLFSTEIAFPNCPCLEHLQLNICSNIQIGFIINLIGHYVCVCLTAVALIDWFFLSLFQMVVSRVWKEIQNVYSVLLFFFSVVIVRDYIFTHTCSTDQMK